MATTPRIQAYSYFIRFLRLSVSVFLRLRFNMTAENRGLVAALKPPYLILPNHVGFWDPFMVSAFVPQAVYWVDADANFRSRLLRLVLRLVGAIPKAKAVTDFEAIRYILAVRDAGGVVGIFGEGQRTWDGAGLPLLYSTAKLVRIMRSPVVTPLFLGGYFSHPRWAYKPRRGKLIVRFHLALTAEEARSLPVDEIYQRLSAAIYHDDYAFQEDQSIRFVGTRIAEDLEHTLFVCPECREIGTLRSAVSYFRCRNCNYSVRYAETGYFVARNPPRFQTIRDWHSWQIEVLPELIDARLAKTNGGGAILEDRDIHAYTGYRSSRMKRVGTGTLLLFQDRLRFSTPGKEPSDFPLDQIRGLNVQLTRHLELYYRGKLYVFYPASRKVSAYKWLNAMEILISSRTTVKER